MQELKIAPFAQISFRLAPFILVSYFLLSSFFRQDVKGFIYLMGLILACIITALIGNIIPQQMQTNELNNRLCNMFTLSTAGTFSKIPLSQTIFGYTFCYLLFVIIKYHLAIQNLSTLVLFPILIAADFVWTANYKCAGGFSLLLSLILGCLSGLMWAYVIDSANNSNLLYFNGLSNEQVCTAPARKTFKIKRVRT
jgi:hypothetical protein